ncbi:hypothetical protein [Chelativorans sp. YIM 93263]|uniref:hypothetical protein n=1 Tax=Chelativorans sp. YIM 93263 TaxID=2906648 RepID=UPI002378A5E3|nr:hypothetical protein [Chelativorans sp. YIM 93263]
MFFDFLRSSLVLGFLRFVFILLLAVASLGAELRFSPPVLASSVHSDAIRTEQVSEVAVLPSGPVQIPTITRGLQSNSEKNDDFADALPSAIQLDLCAHYAVLVSHQPHATAPHCAAILRARSPPRPTISA